MQFKSLDWKGGDALRMTHEVLLCLTLKTQYQMSPCIYSPLIKIIDAIYSTLVGMMAVYQLECAVQS